MVLSGRLMQDSDNPVVLFNRGHGAIACVTLNRPEARNAINAAAAQRLAEVVAQTEEDAEIRVVILTGAGMRAFCAGADLKEVDAGGMGQLFLEQGGFAGLVDAPRTKPWIAAVNGLALAGGCELALACDLIVAVESARFGIPEVARGLIAAGGGAYRLARRIPYHIAVELAVTGRMMSAVEAERWGLVNRMASEATLIDTTFALANEILRNAPLAVAESLALAKASADLSDEALSIRSQAVLTRLASSEDYAEGPRAFIEKRPPVWKGR